MNQRLLTRAPDGLGDLETKPSGSGFAGARSPNDMPVVADPPARRLRPAGRLWAGRGDRDRRRRVAEADALLSAAGAAGGSLGPLCPGGCCAIQRARALGAG